jgi:uncharacterized protein (TIRG00374 family)
VQGAKRGLSSLAKAAWIAVALGAVLWTFRDIDLERVSTLLSGIVGPALVVIFLPQLFALAAESAAWRWTLMAISQHPRFWALLRVRLQTEALSLTLPGGVVLGESIKPYLLGRHCGIPMEPAITSVAARKYLLMASHATYILLCATLGFESLRSASPGVMGRGGLPWLVVGSGLVMAFIAAGVCVLLTHGRVAGRLLALLERLPFAALRKALGRSASRFHRTDRELSRFFSLSWRRLAMPFAVFLGAWLLESVETYLILQLIGVRLSFATVAGFEVALSFLRNVVFVLPAGLGLQDLGYVLFFRALGVPDALNVGAAFSLLKRSKELFWSSIGYGLFAWDLRARAHQPALTA